MQALAQVHQQRQILRATFDAVGDGIIATDTHGDVSWMNPAAERLTGWTADEQGSLVQVLPLEGPQGGSMNDRLFAPPGPDAPRI